MQFKSAYPGKLIFPSGQELSLGDIGEADDANAGIVEFVANEWIAPVDPPPVAAKGKKE